MLEMADGEERVFGFPIWSPTLLSSASRGMADFSDAHATSLGGSSSLCFFLLLASSEVGASEVGAAEVMGGRVEALERGVEGVGENPNGTTALPVCNLNCRTSVKATVLPTVMILKKTVV